MNKFEVFVIAMAESESQRGQYVLILEEPLSKRRIPIIVGPNEAQAIALHLERLQPSRPLTHDLFQSVIVQLNAQLKEVFIHQIKEDVFQATISITGPEKSLQIDSRPSDAIALAVRFNCPLFVSEQVLDEAGYLLDEKGREKKSYAEYTLEELEDLLAKVLAKEDYESATRLRSVIDKRKLG
ncbi:bifunctional nuclease family protein [Runella aurantiaca]|uniref:Bifunctional nuclease family protein n=1 Tax=Runella aurantiaca TaxID=2282308 RepID=A0A369IIA5_9BACT|nr:bifunctional nuclease family protein [Runella aurantiaca]RDB06376.1 bifunctional nuclease family protein [Runella aurantiaca]